MGRIHPKPCPCSSMFLAMSPYQASRKQWRVLRLSERETCGDEPGQGERAQAPTSYLLPNADTGACHTVRVSALQHTERESDPLRRELANSNSARGRIDEFNYLCIYLYTPVVVCSSLIFVGREVVAVGITRTQKPGQSVRYHVSGQTLRQSTSLTRERAEARAEQIGAIDRNIHLTWG